MIRRKISNMAARKSARSLNRKHFAEEENVKVEEKLVEKTDAEEGSSLKEDNLNNLISILDPEKVDGEVVDAIAETTETSKETVEGLIELVANANKEMEEQDANMDEVIAEFSRKSKRIFARERLSKKTNKLNAKRRVFAEEADDSVELAAATAIVGAIDEAAMAKKAAEAVAGIINAATGIDQEAIQNLVEMSKDSFACGVKFAAKKTNKAIKPKNFGADKMKEIRRPVKRVRIDELYDVEGIGHGPEFDMGVDVEDVDLMGDEEMLFARREAARRKLIARRRAFAQQLAKRRAMAAAKRKAFAEGAEGDFVPAKAPNPDRPVAAKKDTMPQAGLKNTTVADQLPLRGTPGIQQNPMNAELDPKEGEVMQSAVPAGEAMATQNELATVQNLTKVPAAASNFQRAMNARTAQKDEFSVLRSVLGAKYIP